MGKWSKSLPEAATKQTYWGGDRAAGALADIAWAMVSCDRPGVALSGVRHAAAAVRAWRKSLPRDLQGERREDDPYWDSEPVREYLRQAAQAIIRADSLLRSKGNALRWAEAHLRNAGKLLQRQIDEGQK